MVFCGQQVDGCSTKLSNCKAYCVRYRVCQPHLSAVSVLLNGVESRFCQQCGRFHELSEFDGNKRWAGLWKHPFFCSTGPTVNAAVFGPPHHTADMHSRPAAAVCAWGVIWFLRHCPALCNNNGGRLLTVNGHQSSSPVQGVFALHVWQRRSCRTRLAHHNNIRQQRRKEAATAQLMANTVLDLPRSSRPSAARTPGTFGFLMHSPDHQPEYADYSGPPAMGQARQQPASPRRTSPQPSEAAASASTGAGAAGPSPGSSVSQHRPVQQQGSTGKHGSGNSRWTEATAAEFFTCKQTTQRSWSQHQQQQQQHHQHQQQQPQQQQQQQHAHGLLPGTAWREPSDMPGPSPCPRHPQQQPTWRQTEQQTLSHHATGLEPLQVHPADSPTPPLTQLAADRPVQQQYGRCGPEEGVVLGPAAAGACKPPSPESAKAASTPHSSMGASVATGFAPSNSSSPSTTSQGSARPQQQHGLSALGQAESCTTFAGAATGVNRDLEQQQQQQGAAGYGVLLPPAVGVGRPGPVSRSLAFLQAHGCGEPSSQRRMAAGDVLSAAVLYAAAGPATISSSSRGGRAEYMQAAGPSMHTGQQQQRQMEPGGAYTDCAGQQGGQSLPPDMAASRQQLMLAPPGRHPYAHQGNLPAAAAATGSPPAGPDAAAMQRMQSSRAPCSSFPAHTQDDLYSEACWQQQQQQQQRVDGPGSFSGSVGSRADAASSFTRGGSFSAAATSSAPDYNRSSSFGQQQQQGHTEPMAGHAPHGHDPYHPHLQAQGHQLWSQPLQLRGDSGSARLGLGLQPCSRVPSAQANQGLHGHHMAHGTAAEGATYHNHFLQQQQHNIQQQQQQQQQQRGVQEVTTYAMSPPMPGPQHDLLTDADPGAHHQARGAHPWIQEPPHGPTPHLLSQAPHTAAVLTSPFAASGPAPDGSRAGLSMHSTPSGLQDTSALSTPQAHALTHQHCQQQQGQQQHQHTFQAGRLVAAAGTSTGVNPLRSSSQQLPASAVFAGSPEGTEVGPAGQQWSLTRHLSLPAHTPAPGGNIAAAVLASPRGLGPAGGQEGSGSLYPNGLMTTWSSSSLEGSLDPRRLPAWQPAGGCDPWAGSSHHQGSSRAVGPDDMHPPRVYHRAARDMAVDADWQAGAAAAGATGQRDSGAAGMAGTQQPYRQRSFPTAPWSVFPYCTLERQGLQGQGLGRVAAAASSAHQQVGQQQQQLLLQQQQQQQGHERGSHVSQTGAQGAAGPHRGTVANVPHWYLAKLSEAAVTVINHQPPPSGSECLTSAGATAVHCSGATPYQHRGPRPHMHDPAGTVPASMDLTATGDRGLLSPLMSAGSEVLSPRNSPRTTQQQQQQPAPACPPSAVPSWEPAAAVAAGPGCLAQAGAFVSAAGMCAVPRELCPGRLETSGSSGAGNVHPAESQPISCTQAPHAVVSQPFSTEAPAAAPSAVQQYWQPGAGDIHSASAQHTAGDAVAAGQPSAGGPAPAAVLAAGQDMLAAAVAGSPVEEGGDDDDWVGLQECLMDDTTDGHVDELLQWAAEGAHVLDLISEAGL